MMFGHRTKSLSAGAYAGVLAAVMAGGAHGQAKSAVMPAPSGAAGTPSAGDRQKAAHADADRLLALAQELKNSVDKSRKDELNVQVIREAEEIEKLARSLRSRVQ